VNITLCDDVAYKRDKISEVVSIELVATT